MHMSVSIAVQPGNFAKVTFWLKEDRGYAGISGTEVRRIKVTTDKYFNSENFPFCPARYRYLDVKFLSSFWCY